MRRLTQIHRKSRPVGIPGYCESIPPLNLFANGILKKYQAKGKHPACRLGRLPAARRGAPTQTGPLFHPIKSMQETICPFTSNVIQYPAIILIKGGSRFEK
jgi:hypothetical protein